MREIKFRAWDKRSKEMLDLTGYKMVGKNNIQLFYYDEDGCRTTCTTLLENIELIQYVGLKDKNGVEIYEGDIVKIKHFKSNYMGKVIFNKKTCGFEIWYNSVVGAYGEKATHKLNFAADIEIEIIGNIYESPELLEVQA